MTTPDAAELTRLEFDALIQRATDWCYQVRAAQSVGVKMPEKKPSVVRREVEKRLVERVGRTLAKPTSFSLALADGDMAQRVTRAQAERLLAGFKAAFPDVMAYTDKLPAMVRARIPPRPRMADFVNHKVGSSRRRGRNASNAYFSALMLWEDRYGA